MKTPKKKREDLDLFALIAAKAIASMMGFIAESADHDAMMDMLQSHPDMAGKVFEKMVQNAQG